MTKPEDKTPRTIKGLLLEMRMESEYEVVMAAQDAITNQFDDLLAENDRLKKELEEWKRINSDRAVENLKTSLAHQLCRGELATEKVKTERLVEALRKENDRADYWKSCAEAGMDGYDFGEALEESSYENNYADILAEFEKES